MQGRRRAQAAPRREADPGLEDLRDDCVALFLNSGMTQEQVHAAGGPTPQTVSRWLYKETRFPRIDTVRSLLRAVGGELVALGAGQAGIVKDQPLESRLGLGVSFAGRPRMPTKRQAARKAARRSPRG